MIETTYAQRLQTACTASGVTGASFAYWNSGELHTAVAGVRNSATRDPVTCDTLMHIGSIAKVINTALVLQLVDDGLISLDEPIITHIPELRLHDESAAGTITCRMLLNHTSGIDCDILPDHGPDAERIQDAIARCAQLRQLHPPGEGPSYCNIGSVIAGYLVQKLRGTSWYTVVEQRVYKPLGMQCAIAHMTDLPRFRHSLGDVTDRATGKLHAVTRPFLPASFAPCGTTLMMTATDLVTFVRMLLNGGLGANGTRILSNAAAAEMCRPTAKILEPSGCHWGLGWMILPNGLLHHAGGGPGVCSLLFADQRSGRVLALLTNCDRWEALRPTVIDPIVLSWVGGQGLSQDREEAFDPSCYTGVYESNLYQADVQQGRGQLVLKLRMKIAVYENISAADVIKLTLRNAGAHLFEPCDIPVGFPNKRFRFARPDVKGRMQAMGWMERLLLRTE